MAAGAKRLLAGILLLGFAVAGPATAQIIDESFEGVTATGGGVFLDRIGDAWVFGWDDGISGENAFAQALGNARVAVSAQGVTDGGVGGSGAGQLSFILDSLNLIDEYFDDVTGLGGGAFLVGDGTPNVSGSTENWDNGIENETAFCHMRGGAVLNGSASAQGLTSGGVDASGAGQIVVNNVAVNSGDWYGGLSWSIPGLPGGSGVLQNPGFEQGLWETIVGWNWWGDPGGSYQSVLIVTTDPQAGSQHIKLWGQAPGMDSAGLSQTLRAEEGQTWKLDCWTQHQSSEGIDGTANYGEMRIEFYDGVDPEPIDFVSSVVLNSSSPHDVWIDNAPIQLTAPEGTLTARIIIQLVSPDAEGGAMFFDSVSCMIVDGPPAFNLADYSLSADVKGDANTGAGEVYGHYQLRIEDEEGDRLVFESSAVADGGWRTIGGSLDQAVEMDYNHQPATGVFDLDSETFNVVVMFDPDRTPLWGTGGALAVDNLLLTNERPDGSQVSGALIWDLPELTELDPRFLAMTADVKGGVAGGKYELKLQGYIAVPNVDEDFSAFTAEDEIQFVEPDDVEGAVVDWSSDIDNDEVFFGSSNATVTATGGAWVRALTDGGYGDDGPCMQIEVRDVWPSTGGYWYAGAVWHEQVLASTDLSQVTLSAKAKGTWITSWLQRPATYILRIEDPDGDWIGFDEVYDRSYQSIGGPLSGYTISGFADGSNGVFDVDMNMEYDVRIVFIGEGPPSSTSGNWGGTLNIDDVYLTPSPSPRFKEGGNVSFTGVADGEFQSVGGLLTEGVSTWPPEGGLFYPEWGTNLASWDVGLEGETAFAGVGWGASIETAAAQGCQTCGVAGSGGGMFNVTGIVSPPGWYWAGVAWPDLAIDMSNLNQASFTADCKGVWNAAQGETPGAVTLRLEDQNGLRISWHSSAVDGAFHTLGGALNNFTAEDGFDYESPSYIATIIVFGHRTPSWGTGATVYFDNLSVTDPSGIVLTENFEAVVEPVPGSLTGMDAFSIELSMLDGVLTWGAGEPCLGDANGDGVVSISDLAVLLANYNTPSGAAFSDGDFDGDGDVDLSDLATLLGVYGDVCSGGEASLTVDNLYFDVTP